jgi:GDP-D-mannose 3',5'-epimerase
MKKNTLVLGAGGFIGSHLAKRLKALGHYVHGADKKHPMNEPHSDKFTLVDLRNEVDFSFLFDRHYDEVYQLAADMGGATYINSGGHDASVVANSALININTANLCTSNEVGSVFFSSSACVYPHSNNLATCKEEEAYPAYPDNEYGWEKLFCERLYYSFQRNLGLNIKIARFHSIVGEESTWTGGREKAHSALARKVATVQNNGSIEVIGDGNQLRTFLHVDDCIDAILLLMDSSVKEIINIGSDHLVSINDYVAILQKISGKQFTVDHIDGPTGVLGRECPIEKAKKLLGWNPKISLEESSTRVFNWINGQVKR